MADYLYTGPRGAELQYQRSGSQPVPCTSYSASMPPTTPDQAHVASYAGIAGRYTPEQLQLHAAGYTAEQLQLHAAGYGHGLSVTRNIMAPASLRYASPANMPLYTQQQQPSIQQQLHALNAARFQEAGVSNNSHNPNLYQQQAPISGAYQNQRALYPAYRQYLDAQSLLASLSQGQQQIKAQGLRRSQIEEAAAHHNWIGLSSPGSAPTLAAAAAATVSSFRNASPAIATSQQHWFRQLPAPAPGLGSQQRLKKKTTRERTLPVKTQEGNSPPMDNGPDPSLEDGLPLAPHSNPDSNPVSAKSPSLEEQLQAEFEYTRLPSVPRRKDYAQMDAERRKVMTGVSSKIFVRSKVRTQKGLDRRERKNASARANAATKRTLVEGLSERERSQMTQEEIELMEKSETARERKNRRSHESHTEKKNEIDRILSRTPEQRTPIETKFLEQELSAKRRKNEGDRLRRLRLKELGYAPSRNTGKIGIPARGPIPAKYPEGSGASVSTASSTASAPAAPAAAQSDEYSIATGQSPTNEGALLTYGYQ